MTPEAVRAAVDRPLLALRERLGPRLRPRFDALCARQGWLTGETGRYTAAVSQPVVVLPLLLAEALGSPLPVLEESLASAIVGYAAVRVHDDWLDEDVGADDPHATALLSHSLFAAHQAATARAAGDRPAFWAFFDRTWQDYSDAMLLERDLLRGGEAGPYDAAAFDRVLLRSRPMALPPATLLARADALERLPALVRLVDAVARASQLLDDSLDLVEEFDAGRFNHLVQRFGGAHGRAALLAGWALGGFATVLEEADVALAAAQAGADELGIGPGFAEFVASRRALMDRLRSAADPRDPESPPR